MFSDRGAVSSRALASAVRALHHRGPDEEGVWIDDAHRVGLGHARLGIIDLAGGRQPLENEDGSIHVVVNGELYDFERVRKDLEARGHVFRTSSDSEIVLHLYEEYGTSCVEHLRGEFAFVLHDSKQGLLFAARDRFGIKPLVYAQLGKTLVVASEAKAIFAAGGAARWDEDTFFQALALGGPLEDRTFFEGVRQLPPGHVLLARGGDVRVVRYWDFDYPLAGEARSTSDEEDIELVRSTVDEAVRLRMRADVEVACYLSGGIDSCAVLGFAARHTSRKVRAFTLAFDRAEYDESALAREMAAHAGAEYTEIPVTQHDFARDFADALFHAERPLNNANSVAKFRLSRAVRDAGVKVVLTGEGSDEIFAGYPHYRRDLFLMEQGARQKLEALERGNAVSRGILMPEGDGLSLVAARAALLGFAPTWLEAFATSGHKMLGFLSPSYRARAERRDPVASFVSSLEVTRQLRGRHPVHQAMYMWSKSVLPNFILSVLGDRMEMAHSVEGRLPLLDHVLVERVARIGIDRLIRGEDEKWILRRAAAPVVTDAIVRRRKHPFFAPPASSAPDGPLHELMQDTLRGPALDAIPFFDRRAIVSVLDALPHMDDARRTAVDAPLMVLVSTCLLHERFGMTTAPADDFRPPSEVEQPVL